MEKRNLFLIAVLFCSICTIQPSFAVDENNFPMEWGSLSNNRQGETDCPMLQGSYQSEGVSYHEFQSGGKTDKSFIRPDNASSIIHWHPRFFQSEANEYLEILDNDSLSRSLQSQFQISSQLPEKFEIYQLNKGVIEKRTFELQAKDFECRNGWVHLRTFGACGNGEGTTGCITTNVKITRLADRSILWYKHLENKWRSLIFFSGQVISDDYYRFKEVRE